MKNYVKLTVASLLSLAILASCDSGKNTSASGNSLVESVTLDETYKVLAKDDSFTLTPTVVLNENAKDVEYDVEWRSSNPYVANVTQEGLVTGLSAGTTTISIIAGYKMAACQVHVPGENEGPGGGGGDIPVPPTPPTPPGPDNPDVPEEEDEEMECTVYFFIDYNNIDENDTTRTKLLAKFKWYGDRPISQSGKVPANPTTSMDPAFPYFIGWSNHTIIDTKDDLWNMNSDVIGNGYYFYLYGIWSDVSQGEFVK